MAVQKQDDQHEHTFSNYVRIQDVVQKTCLRRWTIGKSGERGSGISVLPVRYDDDDIYIYIYIYTYIYIYIYIKSYFSTHSVFYVELVLLLYALSWTRKPTKLLVEVTKSTGKPRGTQKTYSTVKKKRYLCSWQWQKDKKKRLISFFIVSLSRFSWEKIVLYSRFPLPCPPPLNNCICVSSPTQGAPCLPCFGISQFYIIVSVTAILSSTSASHSQPLKAFQTFSVFSVFFLMICRFLLTYNLLFFVFIFIYLFLAYFLTNS